MTSSLSDKKTLRAQALAARAEIAPAYAVSAAEIVAKHFLDIAGEGKIIAGYRAVRGELDVSAALEQLATRDYRLCLPVIVAPREPLLFRRFRPEQALIKGLYDIEIPQENEPVLVPEIVIVPLVAFDRAGHRLGYGAGYYDATIRQLRESQKSVQIVGAAFAAQEIAAIPAEPHDQKLDAVVTEKGIIVMPA